MLYSREIPILCIMKFKTTLLSLLCLLLSGATVLRADCSYDPKADSRAIVINGNARFTVLTPEMIRIEYSDKGIFEDRATFSILNRKLDVPQFTTSEDASFLYIETAKVRLKYRKGTNPVTLPASSANLSVTLNHNGREVLWYPGKPDPVNLKGTCRTLDGSNGSNKKSELENGLVSRSGWAVIEDSWTSARPDGSRSFAFEPDQTVGYDWWAQRKDPHALDIYFLGYGNNYKKALYDFTQVAGKIPLPPAYVFGYWYSKYSSYSADDYRNIMSSLKSNDIHTDVLILDMDWHWNGNDYSMSAGRGGWTGWSWNTNLIPDPVGLLKEIHGNNLKTALNLHPADGINSTESPEFFEEMNEYLRGKYDVKGSSDKTIPWYLDYPDFTNAFFSTIIREHEKEGVDFWWLDWQQHLTSPYTNGMGQTFWCNHVFFNDMAKNRPDHRPLIFHRWGGIGSHRYQIGFSGDACINFPTLAFQPYFTATASNVGYGYWGHDLGGHAITDEKIVNDPELLLRWLQFGAFSPIFRTHATNDSRIERQIWKFPNFPDLREVVNLRYSLFPYIYTMARQTYETGISLCHPLYYEYPDAEEAYKFEDEYFFGNDILVSPIVEAAKDGVSTKTIWFPEGNWWSAATNELIEGPCTLSMNFSKTDIPYFYREGSIVPLNPASVKNVTEHPRHLVLNVIAGKNGEASLYEDDGDNPDYATVYATTALAQTKSGNTTTLTISPRQGNVSSLPASRSYTVRAFNTNTPVAVKVNGHAVTDFTYDADTKCTTVEVPLTDCASTATIEIEETSAGVADISVPKARVFYDKASDTLTAEFGQTRSNVELTMFNLAGSEFVNHKYQNISGFSESLDMLPASNMYICKIVTDKQVIIEKISK